MVSILIPTYQRYDLVLRAIDSADKQSIDKEIIVIDDCSTDVRYSNLKDDKRIIYIKLKKRLGYPGKVRNIGLQIAKGDWIGLLDDDDIWLPNKLEKQSEYFNKHNFICSDALINGKSYSKEIYFEFWNMANPTNKNELDYEIISKYNIIINSTVIIKKQLLQSIGGFNETVRNGEDYLTWLSLTKSNNICFYLNEALIDYNINTYKNYTDEL